MWDEIFGKLFLFDKKKKLTKILRLQNPVNYEKVKFWGLFRTAQIREIPFQLEDFFLRFGNINSPSNDHISS